MNIAKIRLEAIRAATVTEDSRGLTDSLIANADRIFNYILHGHPRISFDDFAKLIPSPKKESFRKLYHAMGSGTVRKNTFVPDDLLSLLKAS